MSRGRGIYLVDDVSEVSLDEVSVVSKYISNPFLINGRKFDLRIYVLVTCLDPLRIYVFKEGLVRFATHAYDDSSQQKTDKFMHLTNYSINKKSSAFVQSNNLEHDDAGSKWSLSAFCSHLEMMNTDMDLFWSRIYDVILKSILSCEDLMFQASKQTCIHRSNCFEIYGYDILIDSDLKPWLVEINLSPSLACDSNLDMQIKSTLIAEALNIVGVRQFDRAQEGANKAKNRMKSYQNRGGGSAAVHTRFQNIFNPQIQDNSIFTMGLMRSQKTQLVAVAPD